MTSPARIFAAAVLTVGLAFPATSHASGLPDLRPAAQPASALALHAVDMLSAGPAGWLLRLFQQVWTKAGPGMDPSGPGASGTSGPTGDNGPGLDPNGPKASHHQVGGPSAPRLLPIAN
jgi:hypothetical protein